MSRNWKRGSLHCHTMWSDGRSLPEVVLHSYKNAGYDFVCLSDHNIYQEDENFWLPLNKRFKDWPPEFYYDEFYRSKKLLPGQIEEKSVGIRTFVRLKPFKQLKKEFHKPGKFLVIPGEEITIINADFAEKNRKYDLHINVFNLAKDFPVPHEGTAEQLIQTIIGNYNAAAAKGAFLMCNHPFARVWDVDPRLLIQFPEIKFFEICNSGTNDMPEGWIMTSGKFWDFILAHRLINGKGLLYATASDDGHFYDPAEEPIPATMGSGWVMVDCQEEFTPEAISEAMFKGEFYATNGVFLEDVIFNPETKTLEVRVKPEDGVTYRIDFITTKKDFDQTITLKEFPMEGKEIHNRTRPIIPECIGQTVQSTCGTTASYTMQEDDLYIRAMITSDQPSMFQAPFYPACKTAWTQPFTLVK